jgi:hypothetical protein
MTIYVAKAKPKEELWQISGKRLAQAGYQGSDHLKSSYNMT